MAELGHTIRTMRIKRNMSIKQLADLTGLTSSHISQIERNLANPSLTTMEAIASIFRVPITALFSANNKINPLVKKDQRETFGPLGIAESLVRNGQNTPFGVYIINVDESPLNTGDIFHHIGTELIYLLEGSFEYHIGEETYILEKGDSLCYDASTPHWGRKLSDSMQLMVVSSPFTIQSGD